MRFVRFVDGGALVAAAAAAALAIAAERPVMPPLLPIGDHAPYDALANRALVLVEPVAHAPWFGTASVVQSALVAAMVIGVLWTATRRLGATAPVALAVCAAALSQPAWRVPLTLGADPSIGLACTWTAALVVTSGMGSGRAALWAALAAAVAVTSWPPLLAVMPLVAALGAPAGRRRTAALLAGGAVGAAAGVALWAARASALSNEAVSMLEALEVVTAGAQGSDQFVWPGLTAATLPAGLALVGAVVIGLRMPPPLRVGLALASAAPLVALVLLEGWRAELVRALHWTSWPLAGVGLTWVAARAPAGRAPWVVAIVGGVLVGAGVSATVRVVGSEERREFARALGAALSPVVATTSVSIVAENSGIDTALVAWGSSRGLQRVRQLPDLVAAALTLRHVVLAGPAARTALELWGFRFSGRVHVDRPVPLSFAAVDGRLHCLPVATPWRELPGVEYTGRLGLHVPAGDGLLEVVIVGPTPLSPRVTWADGRPVGQVSPLPMNLPNLPPVLWPGDGQLPDPSLVGVRLELPALPAIAQAAGLALGQRAPQVAARFVSPAHRTDVATVCAAPLPRDEVVSDAGVRLGDDEYFAGGWHAAERAVGVFRWTARRAVTLLPSSAARAVAVVLTARPAARPGPGPVRIRATVNGWTAGEREMTGADGEYRWLVPEGVWVAGTNELVLEVSDTVRPSDTGSHDTRELGIAVSALRIVPPQ